MTLTRAQHLDDFLALEAELLSLDLHNVREEVIHAALELALDSSMRTVGNRDRLWWWQQLYSVLDHRADRLAELTSRKSK